MIRLSQQKYSFNEFMITAVCFVIVFGLAIVAYLAPAYDAFLVWLKQRPEHRLLVGAFCLSFVCFFFAWRMFRKMLRND